MIDLLLSFALLVWPFGQLLQLSPIGFPLRLQLLDIISVLLLAALLVGKKSRRQIVSAPLFRPLAYFVLAAAASLAVASFRLSREQLVIATAYLLRFVVYTSYYFAFQRQGIKKFLPLLILSASIFLIIGFLQYLFLPDVRFLRYLGFDDHYYRLIGSLLDPNYTGLALVIFVLTCLSSSRTRLLSVFPLAGLALTFSRASYLALALGILFLVVSGKKYKQLLILLLLSVVIYVIPKPFGEGVNLSRTFSITSRLTNQLSAVSLFEKRPILGWGFNTLKQGTDGLIPNLTSGVDNSFLFVLATTGIIGFAAFLRLLIDSWKQIKSPFVHASLLAVISHSFFNNSFFFIYLLPLIFLLLAAKPTKSASL